MFMEKAGPPSSEKIMVATIKKVYIWNKGLSIPRYKWKVQIQHPHSLSDRINKGLESV